MKHRIASGIFRYAVLLAAAAALSSWASPADADDLPRKAVELSRAWNDVVVHVKVVLKVRLIVEGREASKAENEVESLGTVIDPSGLTVLSYTNVDASRIYGDLLRKAKSGGEGTPKIDIQIDVGSVKLLLPDENEIPARIVLRDKDLDLVFVRPTEKPARPMHALDLSRGAAPGLLDEVLILARLGEVAGRIPSVSVFRIEAVLRKPRISYAIDQDAMSGRLGAPVFTTDGKVVGLYLLRVADTAGAAGSGLDLIFGGAGKLGFYPVILPAEEIAVIARQAMEVKDEKAADAPQK